MIKLFNNTTNTVFGKVKIFDSNYRYVWPVISTTLLVAITYFGSAIIGGIVSKKTNIPPKELGYLVAGLLAGIVSLLVSSTNKENEINKYRMQWCENLRNAFIDYIGEITSAKVLLQTSVFKVNAPSKKLESYYKTLIDDIGRKTIINVETKGHLLDIHLESPNAKKQERVLNNKFATINNEFFDLLAMIEHEGAIVARGDDINGADEKAEQIDEKLASFHEEHFPSLKNEGKSYFDAEWVRIKAGSLEYRAKKLFYISLMSVISFSYIIYTNNFYS